MVAHTPNEKEDGHFVLMLTPKQLWPEQEKQAQDVVFVLDTSGSMAGEKIEQAKRALHYCIDSLDEEDRFTVVRFSTGFDAFSDGPLAATRENRGMRSRRLHGASAARGMEPDGHGREVAGTRGRPGG